MGWVYILQSKKNGRYYIGSTTNIRRRIREHKRGKSLATRHLRPLKLVFSQKYDDLSEARKVERKLKSFKRRDIIECIIDEEVIRTKP